MDFCLYSYQITAKRAILCQFSQSSMTPGAKKMKLHQPLDVSRSLLLPLGAPGLAQDPAGIIRYLMNLDGGKTHNSVDLRAP